MILSTRLARVMQLLLGCAFLVGGFLLVRVHHVSTSDVNPTVDPNQVAEVCEERARTTRMFLMSDRIGMSSTRDSTE